ncbi:TetR family transcriptional regulator [Arthrobacter sp. JZ12]|uniref:TetR/AcrR family transcriptional regulator n=1 Tax=Arthrobacter sp. JZ12 TaxID=2654190 RepID=UPI002B46C0D9|nr:TetR/AcrR family transcriptional regulator [Arthrobacter sp. JZ12]WRH25216.1 TetR family transcriptional regulator [Arthrobacter sp. JZ12]
MVTATGSSPRPAGRPLKRVLSQEAITRAALTLIETRGYEGLTMSSLARALKVAPSSLYNHVESKGDVLILVQDHVMTQVDVSGFDTEPWEQAVRRFAWSYRDVFTRHTPLIPIIAVFPVSGAPQTLAVYEAVTRGFEKAGWPESLIVPAIVALESFIFGSAFDATAPEGIFESGGLAGDFPRFTAAVDAQRDGSRGYRADVSFGLGLDALILGLEARRESYRP